MALENDKKVIELNKANVAQLRLAPLDADPDDLQDGDVWYRGDTDKLHVRVNGVTKEVAYV